VRRYGFHGTSHKFVAARGAELAGLDLASSKIITCHVGNGASVTAVLNGKSYCTSMGFSPVDGLVMGTRCGDVDPSALIYIAEKEGMSYSELTSMINKRSGVEGVSGVSSDMRDIDAAYEAGNEKAILARDMYYSRVKQYVGKYAAMMGGVDLIVFTGGVGENSGDLREGVCKGLEFMGVSLDEAVNMPVRGVDTIVSTADSRVKVAVIATDEELVIATDTYNLTK
jgi:acetate kinase